MVLTISRRTMLKGSAATLALAAFGTNLFGKSGHIVEASPDSSNNNRVDETVYSMCRQCVLPPCGIKVDVKDGVAIRVEGNPETPTNKGKLCSRGNATIPSVYNPYRVKTPLKRTNPNKGLDQDPQWQEISWEEALTTIAEKLKEIRADDPRKFVWNNGFARAGSILEGMEFCEAFGTPNYIEVDGPTCSVHFGCSELLGNFTGPAYDPAYTKYLVDVGEGANATDGYAPQMQDFANAVANGMKVVIVDPVCKIEASKGEWIPIRPGTDLAFVLSMQYVIVHELKKFDVDFIKKRTNAPYLIKEDGHYARDKSTNKPLVWDNKLNTPKTFDDKTVGDYALEGEFLIDNIKCQPAFQAYAASLLDYTPEWAEEKTTVPASTIRRIASEFVANAQIGSTITINGTSFPYRPVCFQVGRGSVTQFYGGNFHCASVIVNMLVGALDVPGGGLGSLGPNHKSTPKPLALKPNKDGIVEPKVEAVPRKFEWPPNRLDAKTFFPYSHDNPHLAFDAILDPEKYYLDYTPEVMLVWGGNPILRLYQPEKVEEAMKKMKFIFAISYTVDEPSLMADIVLPEAVGLERWSAATRPGMVDTPNGPMQAIFSMAAQQVIERVYDSRQPEEIFIDLAERVGILYGKGGVNDLLNTGKFAPVPFGGDFKLDLNTRYSAKELADLALKAARGGEVNIDAMRHEPKPPAMLLPAKANYPSLSWPAGTTRYALYIEDLLTKGEELRKNLERVGAKVPGWEIEDIMEHYQPMIKWMEKKKEIPQEFDLYAVNWKTAQYSFGNGGSAENPWLEEVSKMDPYLHVICMNHQTAEQRGLKDGDTVRIESFEGQSILEGKLKLSEAFHHEIVGIAGLFGHTSGQMNPIALKGLHFNKLMSSNPGDIDPIGGGFDGSHKVKIYKV